MASTAGTPVIVRIAATEGIRIPATSNKPASFGNWDVRQQRNIEDIKFCHTSLKVTFFHE
jgi:hypothetical protein